MGRLVLVPTPLGNLGDITLRALETLRKADCILAEDTRTTQHLLQHFEISARLRSFHLNNEHQMLQSAVELVRQQSLVALVSDAGTPGISDPGFLLVRACREAGLEVECLPGPVALIPALVSSGFPTDRFIFEGFLPHKKGRQRRISALLDETRTAVFYESPHRLLKTLEQAIAILGAQRKAAVVREISKLHEECRVGTLQSLFAHFSKTAPRGEIVFLIHPAEGEPNADDMEASEIDPVEAFLKGTPKRKKV